MSLFPWGCTIPISWDACLGYDSISSPNNTEKESSGIGNDNKNISAFVSNKHDTSLPPPLTRTTSCGSAASDSSARSFSSAHSKGERKRNNNNGTLYVVKEVIGSPDAHTLSNSNERACPCCQRYIESKRTVLKSSSLHCHQAQKDIALERSLPGTLQVKTAGVPCRNPHEQEDCFQIKTVVAKGWIYKKGTGQDWWGSTGWKQRWAELTVSVTREARNVLFLFPFV